MSYHYPRGGQERQGNNLLYKSFFESPGGFFFSQDCHRFKKSGTDGLSGQRDAHGVNKVSSRDS